MRTVVLAIALCCIAIPAVAQPGSLEFDVFPGGSPRHCALPRFSFDYVNLRVAFSTGAPTACGQVNAIGNLFGIRRSVPVAVPGVTGLLQLDNVQFLPPGWLTLRPGSRAAIHVQAISWLHPSNEIHLSNLYRVILP